MSNGPETPVRSPAYPVWSLSESVTAVAKIEGIYRNGKVDREAAAKLVGYSGLSGPANKALAALAQFGLVERAGKGEMRVTHRARAILHPDNEQEKRGELWAAAMEPKLFRELHERWPGIKPPEEGIVLYLNRQGFNKTAIRPAAKAYLQTLLYLEEAGASESHGSAAPDGQESTPAEEVEPMETVVEERPRSVEPVSTVPLSARVELGEVEWARNQLGKGMKVRLLVSGGEMGAKEIGKLIKLLEAQKAVLADDDEDEDAG